MTATCGTGRGRRRSGERGSATVWMIGVTASAFLMVGLVLDGGTLLRARADAFSTAAAAARVGAQELDPASAVEGVAVLDPIAAERSVLDYLAARGERGTVTVSNGVVTVTVTGTARLQMLSSVSGDAVEFDATASAEAVKVQP